MLDSLISLTRGHIGCRVMVEQSPPAISGELGDPLPAGPAERLAAAQTGPSGAPAKGAQGVGSVSGLGTGAGTRRLARALWSPLRSFAASGGRGWRAGARQFVRSRVWPGPWAGQEPAHTLGIRDLPAHALRSDVLVETGDGSGALMWARSRALSRAERVSNWEAMGQLGACFRIGGRPSPLVVRQLTQPANRPRSRALIASARPTWLPLLPGVGGDGDALGMRWARDMGFAIDAPGRACDADLCIISGEAVSRVGLLDRAVLQALVCDAVKGLRRGGLLVMTVPLRDGACGGALVHGGFGIAELRALVAALGEDGIDLIGDLDRDVARISAARTAGSASRKPGQAAPYAYARLVLRRRGRA